MSRLFLTRDELEELTGYALPAYQRAWLERRKWKFERAANGRPIVLRAHAEAMLSSVEKRPEAKLNLEVLRRAA